MLAEIFEATLSALSHLMLVRDTHVAAKQYCADTREEYARLRTRVDVLYLFLTSDTSGTGVPNLSKEQLKALDDAYRQVVSTSPVTQTREDV